MRKLSPRNQLIGTLLLTGAIALNSVPAFHEGLAEIKNEPCEGVSGVVRRTGFYCLIFGYVWIWVVGRGSIPVLGIKL